MTAAILKKVGQVVGSTVEFDTARVCMEMKYSNILYRRKQVVELGHRFQQSLLTECRNLLRGKSGEVQGDALSFLLCLKKQPVNVTSVKTRVVHDHGGENLKHTSV